MVCEEASFVMVTSKGICAHQTKDQTFAAVTGDIVVLHTGIRQEIKLLYLGVEESPITPMFTSSWLGFSFPSFSHSSRTELEMGLKLSPSDWGLV